MKRDFFPHALKLQLHDLLLHRFRLVLLHRCLVGFRLAVVPEGRVLGSGKLLGAAFAIELAVVDDECVAIEHGLLSAFPGTLCLSSTLFWLPAKLARRGWCGRCGFHPSLSGHVQRLFHTRPPIVSSPIILLFLLFLLG